MENENGKKKTVKNILVWTAAGVTTLAVGVLLFSLVGVAVFFLPLLGGAFSGK